MTTSATAGQSTLRTGPSWARPTNGLASARDTAWTPMTAQAAIRSTASQNGKKPLFGPSVDQPMPSRAASKTTTPPNKRSTDAVTMSATRMPWELLLQQSPFGHEILVELLVLLHPLHVLGAGGERGLQRPVAEVLLEVGGVVDFLQEADVPVHGVLRHARRPEDPAQHHVVHVRAKGLPDRRDVLPLGDGDARRVEDGERADP